MCAAGSGFVALLGDEVSKAFAEIVARTTGALHVVVHCDPGLLSLADLLARAGLPDLLDASPEGRARYLVLELVNLLAAPSTYWIEGLGGPRRAMEMVPENVLVLASPGSARDPNPISLAQLRALVPTASNAIRSVPVDLPIPDRVLDYAAPRDEVVKRATAALLEAPLEGVAADTTPCLIRHRAFANQVLGVDDATATDMAADVARHLSSIGGRGAELPHVVAAIVGKEP